MSSKVYPAGIRELRIFPSREAALAAVEPGSLDLVVSCFVMCSVASVPDSVRDFQKWLKPGGRFVFLEHIGDPRGSLRRWFQDAIVPPWSYCFDCHPNRDIGEQGGLSARDGTMSNQRMPLLLSGDDLADADGWSEKEIHPWMFSKWGPIAHGVWGTLVK